MNAPLRIGILGAARIARSFVSGVQPSTAVTVTAVASREESRAREFATEFGIGRSYSSYEALLAAPDIDAIYNPLPNALHAAWSIRALEAGKHVLCEKPLCVSGAEAHALFAAARASGRHLVEGYPYLAQPQTLRMRELLAAGAIGRVRLVQSSFAFTLDDPGNVRLDAALGGGALYDLGSYLVSLIRIVAGALPLRVSAVAGWTDGGVDTSLSGTLEFADGLLAQLQCSFGAALHRQALIVGTDGTIDTTFRNHTDDRLAGDLKLRQGRDKSARDSVIETPAANGFRAEAESFAALISSGAWAWSGATPQESIDVALIIETLLRSARERRTLDLPAG